MYEKIVIATDGSPNATMALEVGVKFSNLLKLKPVVVHVMDVVGPFGAFLDPNEIMAKEDGGMRKMYETIEKESEKVLLDAAHLSKKFSTDIEPILLRGAPIGQLIHYASQHDLLFVGAHGKDARKKYGMGSVSERVVRHMPCDVFVVRSKVSCKRILVALAGCPHDEIITKKGLWLAKELYASVTAVHIVSPREILSKEVDRTLIVEKAKGHGDRMGVKVKPMVVEGSPTHKLISLSATYDLIVMGTLGVTSLPDLLIGSTAERVTRHARSSVLVVRSPGFQE